MLQRDMQRSKPQAQTLMWRKVRLDIDASFKIIDDAAERLTIRQLAMAAIGARP